MPKPSLAITAVFATAFFGSVLRAADAPVTIKDDGTTYTLSNGILSARISRTTGNLMSLDYKGIETLDPNGRNSGYWSHSAAADQGFAHNENAHFPALLTEPVRSRISAAAAALPKRAMPVESSSQG